MKENYKERFWNICNIVKNDIRKNIRTAYLYSAGLGNIDTLFLRIENDFLKLGHFQPTLRGKHFVKLFYHLYDTGYLLFTDVAGLWCNKYNIGNYKKWMTRKLVNEGDNDMQKVTVEIRRNQLEEFKVYLYERENAPATIQKYLTDVRTFIKYLGGDFIVDKKRLMEYKEWLLESYTVNSVNSMVAALNQYLTFLGMSSLKVKRIKVQKNLFLQEDKELTVKEYQKLLRTALKEGKYQLALCMETIASTGIRISELAAFTVEAIKKEYIEIVNKGKYRRIFLPKGLREKLLRFAKEQGLQKGPVFVTRNGKAKNRSNIWREMKALKEKAGVDGKKIFPHNLRHLFARTYYEVTKDVVGLGDLLGHSSLNVTRIYTSNSGKIYQKQLDLMNQTKLILNT